ncbi:uncharacterized protein LOC134191319 [Corticium candelabrum]|uniref:uncharacterized protein LOC134191319 n=1 Tax=Corticium candelabrum TaxID=121492 RepID=UPI002E27149A|nr:uncharacterized protein LOC134191319 [Corticium candelabrum]
MLLRVYKLNGSFVEVPKGSAEPLMNRVAKVLGLKDSSQKYFTLAKGNSLERPLSILTGREEHSIEESDVVCVRKWCFDVADESKLISTDDVALNLIFQEAFYGVNSGRLQPNDEQRAELDSYCDPSFPVEKQYVLLCHRLSEYNRIDVHDCQVVEQTKVNGHNLTSGTQLSINLTTVGIRLVDAKNGKSIDYSPWQKIRGWRFSQSEKIFSYEIALVNPQMEYTFVWIVIRTEQLSYILSVIDEIVVRVKTKLDGPKSFLPRPFTGQEKSGLRSFVNDLFSIGKSDNFSTI